MRKRSPGRRRSLLFATWFLLGIAVAAPCATPSAALAADRPATEARPPAYSLSEREARDLVTRYYHTKGVWAGVFTLESIEKIRLEVLFPGQVSAHVKYRFRAIPGNSHGRTDEGLDQRIFRIRWNGERYEVVSMEGYNSAIF